MEDAHAHILDLNNDPKLKESKELCSFFGVYDGHGGSTVARFSGDTVHSRLQGVDDYKSKNYEAALKRAFLATDEDLRSNPDFQNDPSGCTAVVTLIDEKRRIICANAGDSRSVLSVKGEAKAMSHDHKPVNKDENARIVAGGGFVEFGRVNGNLALSRALGDFEFKQNGTISAEKQVVTADPDIIVHDPTDDDEFLILACDGIWDVMTSQNTVDFIRRSIADRQPLDKVCESVIDFCLAPDSDWGGVGCDNMTIMIVAILGDRTQEQWYDWMVERVNNNVGYETPQLRDLPHPFTARSGGGRPGILSGQLGGAQRNNAILLGQGESSDDGYGGTKEVIHQSDDEEDDEQTTLTSLAAALRREGLPLKGNDMDVDEKADQENDEIPSDAVKEDGLSDKSEDPLKALTS